MIHISDQSTTNLAAKLGANHGYRIEGDIALLHAEVEVPRSGTAAREWALQLWACEGPHEGGPLSGLKIAEAALLTEALPQAQPLRLDTEALARVPGGQRDYAMVLVLASGESGSFTQVHDFANYPSRQRFVTPHLDGSVGYRIDGEEVVISAERISSPRRMDNLSGSLSLELWALAAPHRGGALEGAQLASVELGQLAGQSTFEDITERVSFRAPAPGRWTIVLALREWVGELGYVTRDYANFEVDFEVAAPAVNAEPVKVEAAKAEPAKVEPAKVEPVKVEPVKVEASKPAADTRVSIMRGTVEELAAVKGLTKKLAVGDHQAPAVCVARRARRCSRDRLEDAR